MGKHRKHVSTKTISLVTHLVATTCLAYVLHGILQLNVLYTWFVAANILTFFTFGKDKLCAKMDFSRTPEITFHIMGLLGAFPAIILGRQVFHHKTSKVKFFVPMWILFFIQVALAIYIVGNEMPKQAAPKTTAQPAKTTSKLNK